MACHTTWTRSKAGSRRLIWLPQKGASILIVRVSTGIDLQHHSAGNPAEEARAARVADDFGLHLLALGYQQGAELVHGIHRGQLHADMDGVRPMNFPVGSI